MKVAFQELATRFDVDFDASALFQISFGQYMVDRTFADYTGPYEVTPMITSQRLETADKHMNDDVSIFTIPTREESNPSGGVTFIIGG